MHQPLRSSEFKLKRARTHLEFLYSEIERFRHEQPYRLERYSSAEGTGRWRWTWVAEQVKPFPEGWPIIVGELLYNVQSSLDNLMWALAARQSEPCEPSGHITFPIFKKKGLFCRKDRRTGDFTRWSGAGRLPLIPSGARQWVVEVQPYQCGDTSPTHPLWLLHELGNEDKHKALHFAWGSVGGQRITVLERQDVVIEEFEVISEPFENRAEVGWLIARTTGRKPKIHVKPGFAFQEVFAKGGPAAGMPVYDTLRDIFNFVVDEVFAARFAPFFSATGFG